MTVEPIAALRDTFLRRIDAHEVYIGIIGQGYVGLPLALTFVEKGFRVLASTRRGEGRGPHRGSAQRHVDRVVKSAARERSYRGAADFNGCTPARPHCVPTP